MNGLVVPYAAVAATLAVAGGFKLRSPSSTVGALRAMGLPGSVAAVRLLGAGELVLGGASLVAAPRWTGPVVAAVYMVFAAYVVAARRRGARIQTCGCFGGLEVPPTLLHVVVDLVAAAVALGAAASSTPSVPRLSSGLVELVMLGGAAATATFLVVTMLTALPQALAVRGAPT